MITNHWWEKAFALFKSVVWPYEFYCCQKEIVLLHNIHIVAWHLIDENHSYFMHNIDQSSEYGNQAHLNMAFSE